MAISSLPLAVFAANANKDSSVENVPSSITEVNGDVSVLYEDTDRRSEYAKHYLLSDGSYVAVQYSEPIHTLNETDVCI